MLELFRIFGTIGLNGVNETMNDLDDITNNANASSGKIVGFFKKIGAAVGTYFAVDKIKDFGVKIVQTAADVQAQTAQFEAAFKELADSASQMFERVSNETGIFATRLQTTGTKAYSQLKGAGLDSNDALAATEQFLNLAADAAAYYDISLEDAEARIRSFMRGNVEAGDAIGLFTSEGQRNAYAIQNYGAKWINLTEAQKQMLMLNISQDIYDQAGATGQAARESDGLVNITGNLKEVWRQFLAVIGSPVLQKVTPIIQKLTTIVQDLMAKVEELKQWIADNEETINAWKTGITDAVIVIGTLIAAFKVAQIVNTLTTGFQAAQVALSLYSLSSGGASVAQGVLNGTLTASEAIVALLTGKMTLAQLATGLWAKAQAALNASFLASPITWIIVGIAALIAIIVVVIKHWDEIKVAAEKAWEKIKEIWDVVATWFDTNVVQPIVSFFQGLWESISGFFVNLWNDIVSIFTTVINWLRTNIAEPIANFYEKWIAPVVNKLIEIVTKLIEIVVALFVGLWNLLNENVIQPIVEGFRQLWKNVSNFFTNLWNDIVAIWQVVSGWFNTNVIQPISNFFKNLWNGIKNTATNAWNGIKNIFSPVVSFFSDVFQKAYTAVTNVFSKIGSFFSGIWDGIKNTFSKLGTSISNAIGGAVKSGINGVISIIEKTINGAISLINGAIKLINLLPGVNVKSIAKLSMPRLAKGGVLERGQVGLLEGTGAEAVVPLERNKAWLSRVAEDLNEIQQSNGGAINERVETMLERIIEVLEQLTGMKIYLDGDKLVGGIAPKMNYRLAELQTASARGR